jgi:hypothetical protein
MVKMPKEVMDMFGDREATKMLATVDAEGKPNNVPIGTFSTIDEETIAFADVFLGKTKKNLEETKKAAVTVYKGLKGYQVKGAFQGVQKSGELFEKMAKQVKEMLKLDIKGVGTIKVEEVYNVSPGPDAGKKIA